MELVNRNQSLEISQPKTQLDRMESWASLSDEDRKRKAAQALTLEEIAALLSTGNDREKALVLLAADAGLRLSEVASLKWRDLNRQARTVIVQSGKGRKKRTVKLTGRTANALQTLKRDGEEIFGVSSRRIQVIFKSLCRRAGVEHRGYHALRHSAGTELYRLTRSLKLVARHLGHSNTSVSDRYAHLADMDYEKAIDSMGTLEPVHA